MQQLPGKLLQKKVKQRKSSKQLKKQNQKKKWSKKTNKKRNLKLKLKKREWRISLHLYQRLVRFKKVPKKLNPPNHPLNKLARINHNKMTNKLSKKLSQLQERVNSHYMKEKNLIHNLKIKWENLFILKAQNLMNMSMKSILLMQKQDKLNLLMREKKIWNKKRIRFRKKFQKSSKSVKTMMLFLETLNFQLTIHLFIRIQQIPQSIHKTCQW